MAKRASSSFSLRHRKQEMERDLSCVPRGQVEEGCPHVSPSRVEEVGYEKRESPRRRILGGDVKTNGSIGKWYIKGDIFRFKTRYISDPSEADTYYKKSLQPINMRFLVLPLLVLTVLMVQRTSCQRGPTGPVGQQIMCYSCLGNDQFKMECCGSTNQCCGGKVKKLGSFPQPATTAPGR
ncbi:hypothetical protein CDAR_520121 [Caerostris darwini]|uniref:Uncharacterized protein n=1 Tax=Caerostris darwini TaxID=1538125 RepID=A0AAV4TXI0_9ARAC|nr:hypothetical protein CDAR_520121 [Caerostris darwini]